MKPLRVLCVLLAIAIGGCAEDEEAPERELQDAAREFAEQTAALQADVARAARALPAEGVDEGRAERELEDLERRAVRLRDRVEQTLPEGYAARESLRAANKRTVRAIQDIREFVQVGDDGALGRARARLDAARQRLAAAADELSGAPGVIAP